MPIGPVWEGTSEGYREVWKLAPDTEAIRLNLLNLLSQIQEQPPPEYPMGIYVDDVVIWQVGELQEVRALEDLHRIASFSPMAAAEGDPFKRNRKSTVAEALRAIEKIEGILPLDFPQEPPEKPHPTLRLREENALHLQQTVRQNSFFTPILNLVAKIPRLIWVVMGVGAINWLLYLPFLGFGWVGIYPLATLYSKLFGYPIGLLIIHLLLFLSWVTIAWVLCVVLLCYIRQRTYRRILSSLLTVPLLALAMFPLEGTFVHWQSLTVEPWGQTYHVAYRASAFDPDYGAGMLFECERTGILCRNIKSFPYWDGLRMSLKLQYDPKHDYLTLWRQGFSSAIYRRMRNIVLCDKTYASNSYAPVCKVNND
jgi:hypothetical protein